MWQGLSKETARTAVPSLGGGTGVTVSKGERHPETLEEPGAERNRSGLDRTGRQSGESTEGSQRYRVWALGVPEGWGRDGIRRPAWTLVYCHMKSHMPLLPEAKETTPLGGGKPISQVPKECRLLSNCS